MLLTDSSQLSAQLGSYHAVGISFGLLSTSAHCGLRTTCFAIHHHDALLLDDFIHVRANLVDLITVEYLVLDLVYRIRSMDTGDRHTPFFLPTPLLTKGALYALVWRG